MRLKIRVCILLGVVFMFISAIAYGQKYKSIGIGIIDTVLKYRKTKRVIEYDTINIKDESISGLKLPSTLAILQQKFGKGVPLKKKYIENMPDVDNPKIVYRNYIRYDSTMFEVDDQDVVFGFVIETSIFELEPLGIKIGDKLEVLAIKLPISFHEIAVYGNRFDLMIRVTGLDCGDCRGNIGLSIDRKTRRLISIRQRIEENNF